MKKEVKRGYYPNGKLEWKRNFVNGQLNGVSKLYYKNGKIRKRENWVNGLRHGLCVEY